MAYRRTVRGLGMLPGYQIVGACDPKTGAATAMPSTYANVMDPSGKLTCYGPNDPAYLALLGTPAVQQPPSAASSVPTQKTLSGQVPAALLPSGNQTGVLASSSTFGGIVSWIENNPLWAAGIVVGGILVLKGLK